MFWKILGWIASLALVAIFVLALLTRPDASATPEGQTPDVESSNKKFNF